MGIEGTSQDLVSESTKLLQENPKRKGKKVSKLRMFAVMVSCIMQQITVSGLGYGLSVMYAELVIVFSALRADAAVIQSLNMGLATSAGIFFVGLIRKLGFGTSIVVGSTVASLGLFISAFADGLVPIILCTGVLTGLGFSVTNLTSYMVTGWMFPNNASFFLIMLTTGISLGQFIYPLLVDMFIAQYSWSGAFILMAAVNLHSVPCGIIIYFSKEYFASGRELPAQKKTSSIFDTALLKNPVLWIITMNALLLFGTASMEAWFLVDHMVSSGFTRESGTILVSIVGMGSFTGRFVGLFLRYKFRFPTSYHWIYLFVAVAGLHALIINLTNYWALAIVCFVYGVMFATCGSQLPAITFEASGSEKYTQSMAMVNLLSGLGDIFGPIYGGFIKDTSGIYDAAFYTASGASVFISAATVVMVIIERHRTYRNKTDVIESDIYNKPIK